MTAVPHFSLPFRFVTPHAATNEQDSLDEIVDAVMAILVCPAGFRVELPAFGLLDPTFTVPAPDLEEIRETIETWEPRAAAVLSDYPDLLDELAHHVEIDVQLRTED